MLISTIPAVRKEVIASLRALKLFSSLAAGELGRKRIFSVDSVIPSSFHSTGQIA
ncbi:MAG: hypothetical protein LBS74_04410 [Oscillospiraceae bacterium]|jgi:hypothetical protein|nr:hypothetical protein [Oscillospiraceae bacterium]